MLVDVLLSASSPTKAQHLCRAIYEGAQRVGHDAVLTTGNVRAGAILVLYGLGGPDRIAYANRRGLIAFDCGYWDRKLGAQSRRYRVAFNGFHSPDMVMLGDDPSPDRMRASGVLAEPKGGNPKGPIMLVGNAPKSNRIGAEGWTAAMSRRIRKALPGRFIAYRPKPKRPFEQGVSYDRVSTGAIDDELRGVSLVVCRHSNVAVDACRAGVPVVCEDGAAAAIYPKNLECSEDQPTHDDRQRFLARLAWWQWSADECASGEFWRWADRWLPAIQ